MKILFICMGNIFRSPFAAACMKQFVGCEVISAGTASYHVGKSSPEIALEAARTLGYDLTDHRAEQVSLEHVVWADEVFYMDGRNAEQLAIMFPDIEGDPKISCLAQYIGLHQIADPYEQPLEEVVVVFREIAYAVQELAKLRGLAKRT